MLSEFVVKFSLFTLGKIRELVALVLKPHGTCVGSVIIILDLDIAGFQLATPTTLKSPDHLRRSKFGLHVRNAKARLAPAIAPTSQVKMIVNVIAFR
jgi:hypothetical protein